MRAVLCAMVLLGAGASLAAASPSREGYFSRRQAYQQQFVTPDYDFRAPVFGYSFNPFLRAAPPPGAFYAPYAPGR